MKRTIGIVGGGAAGMTAAIYAARCGAEVTIFEGNDRLGKKLLATGNGKCNLGNMDLSEDKYNAENPELLWRYMEKFGTDATIEFFRGLGLLIKQKNGYLYPVSEQAASVLDVLRFAIQREPKIQVKLQCRINRMECDKKKGQVRLWSEEKEAFTFDRVILTCGGKASPKTGSDGSGYKLAGMLGHSLIPVVPALVQLKCREDWFKSVSGVRAEAEVSLRDGERLLSERGELQLTDYGISGIPVFQLSRDAGYILRRQKEVTVKLDFMPDFTEGDFAEKMMNARAALENDGTVEEYFTGVLNKKLMLLFIRLAGLKPSEEVKKAEPQRIKNVYRLCRELNVRVYAANSFEGAQVCAGGVPLSEVTERLESKVAPGVYFAGELLDVDGKCGGYNLQWAWCSGCIAGVSAADGEIEDVAG